MLSEDISHKSDVGGVRLGLRIARRRAGSRRADARARGKSFGPTRGIEGFTVQPMIVRPNAHELLIGVYEDRLFGPMILFGAGGTATEIMRDTAVALPPLDRRARPRSHASRRASASCSKATATGRQPTFERIADALVRLSQLVVDCPAVSELDINPLLADERAIIALDARISIDPAQIAMPGPNPRLAIRPYPNQWEAGSRPRNGLPVLIRPIRPADEHLYRLSDKLSPEDIRFRFLAPRKEFSHKTSPASRRSTMPAPWPSSP